MSNEDIIVDPIEQVALLAELASEECECELSHGQHDLVPHAAIDWLVIPMGFRDENGVESVRDKLTVPICQDCQEGLSSGEWYLFYCTGCGASAWGLRELTRRQYDDTLVLMKHCHQCYGTEAGGN